MTLIEAVRAHALAHYEKGGWDYVVECWTDDDIRAAIGKARTVSGAIAKVRAAVSMVDERRREVKAEADYAPPTRAPEPPREPLGGCHYYERHGTHNTFFMDMDWEDCWSCQRRVQTLAGFGASTESKRLNVAKYWPKK